MFTNPILLRRYILVNFFYSKFPFSNFVDKKIKLMRCLGNSTLSATVNLTLQFYCNLVN